MIILFNQSFLPTLRIEKVLNGIPGIGKKMGEQILDGMGISKTVQLINLSRKQLNRLENRVNQNYLILDNLRLKKENDLLRLSGISCYRGYRHSQGLPCRGQRTHGNGKTCRQLRIKRVR